MGKNKAVSRAIRQLPADAAELLPARLTHLRNCPFTARATFAGRKAVGAVWFCRKSSFSYALLALAACRPDQIKHLPGTKQIAEETANWEVKRIMPNDLLQATRWAGDSLTAYCRHAAAPHPGPRAAQGQPGASGRFLPPPKLPARWIRWPASGTLPPAAWSGYPPRLPRRRPSQPPACAPIPCAPIGRPAAGYVLLPAAHHPEQHFMRTLPRPAGPRPDCGRSPNATSALPRPEGRGPAAGRGTRSLAAHAGPQRRGRVLHHENPQEVEGA
ncbi:MAG: hypothetical protein WKG07_45215 [Hymenobacter sp.]